MKNHRKEIRQLEKVINDLTRMQEQVSERPECVCQYDMALSMMQSRHYKLTGNYYTPKQKQGGTEHGKY